MAVLTRVQFQFLDRLFFDAAALQQVVAELWTLKKADAQESADPTAREAVEGLAEIPAAMTYNRPEACLRVVKRTWEKYSGTPIGDAMCRRYKLREGWTRTVLAPGVYFFGCDIRGAGKTAVKTAVVKKAKKIKVCRSIPLLRFGK